MQGMRSVRHSVKGKGLRSQRKRSQKERGRIVCGGLDHHVDHLLDMLAIVPMLFFGVGRLVENGVGFVGRGGSFEMGLDWGYR